MESVTWRKMDQYSPLMGITLYSDCNFQLADLFSTEE